MVFLSPVALCPTKHHLAADIAVKIANTPYNLQVKQIFSISTRHHGRRHIRLTEEQFLSMRRLAWLFASAIALVGCSTGNKGGTAAFICEAIPGEGDTFKRVTLDDYKRKLDSSESLAAFHNEEFVWVYDRETGDLYEYDYFEDALVPLKDMDGMKSTGSLSNDGKMLKIKTVENARNGFPGERVEDEVLEIFDIDSSTIVYEPGEKDEMTTKCMEVPTAGIDIQWADKKG